MIKRNPFRLDMKRLKDKNERVLLSPPPPGWRRR